MDGDAQPMKFMIPPDRVFFGSRIERFVIRFRWPSNQRVLTLWRQFRFGNPFRYPRVANLIPSGSCGRVKGIEGTPFVRYLGISASPSRGLTRIEGTPFVRYTADPAESDKATPLGAGFYEDVARDSALYLGAEVCMKRRALFSSIVRSTETSICPFFCVCEVKGKGFSRVHTLCLRTVLLCAFVFTANSRRTNIVRRHFMLSLRSYLCFIG